MQDPVQEVKSRLDILDVVAPYVTLKKSGKYHKACCPFHQEKTPSFFVNPERQIAYCFSCEKGGDMFQFIQEIEGVNFREALELLADKAGIELPEFKAQGPKVSKDQKDRLRAVNKDTVAYYMNNLWETADGKKVQGYLEQRGMTEKTLKEFGVGFARDSKDDLYRYLLNQKHEKDDILASSVVVARDSESKVLADRFHVRLMIPIHDVQGNSIAFGGRALKKGDNPKYLNSPEYMLYDKGSILYNMNRAKKPIREHDSVVVVEGYFDVMASHQAGVEHVVATCGTALTEKQFKLMKRYTKKILLAFDSDNAGQAALLRGVETAQPLGLQLYVVQIPEGKDAADAVKEDPQLWLDAVANAKPYLDYFEDLWQKRFDLNTAQGKRDYSDAMMHMLQGVQHPVERDHYVKRLSEVVGTPLDMLYDYINQMKSQVQQRQVREKEPEKVQLTKHQRLLKYFVGLILAFPKQFFDQWERLSNAENFMARAKAIGLVQPMHRFSQESLEKFKAEFENWLEEQELSIPVHSVYKAASDHYNRTDAIDEDFFQGLEQGDELKRLAFQAELQNRDMKIVDQEMTKLIALLYLDFTA